MKKLRGHEVFLMAAFAAAVNLLFVFVHECWRDEAQAWLIARDNNIFSLFDVTSWEGHPCLWFLTLMPFARLGFPYFTLKLISYFIMLAVIIIIALKAPFENHIKALFILSPLCIYCFVTPARVYCLCALFTVLAAMIYKNRLERPFLYGIVLALNLQTHIIMAGFVVAACFEWLYSACHDRRFTKKFVYNILGMAIPFLSGLFLLYEFRDTFSSPIVTSEHLIIIDRWLIEVCVIIFLTVIIYIWAAKIGLKAGGASFIVLSAAAWQIYIHLFIYYLHMYKIIIWITFLMWLMWVIYDENTQFTQGGGGAFTQSLKKFITFSTFIIILTMAGHYYYKYTFFDLFYKFSGGEGAAIALESLPDNAIIFEPPEKVCKSVIPYLRTKKIYSLTLQKNANYTEFIAAVRKMFPNIKDFWLICNPDSDRIKNLQSYLRDEDLYYTDKDELILMDEHFSIYHVKLQ